MEAAAGVAAASRGVSLPMPSSQPSRKEWRAVSENTVRNAGNEELERSKMGQSDERLIYEGSEPTDVDFCSITVDGGLDNDILQQRLHNVMKQREELQQMEVELRARLVARSEIMEMQKMYDAQIQEQANTSVKLQEQLNHREETIRELERRMEEKERELHAIRLDNEAQAWAKEDLLREQNKELATFRRERDNSDAERAQHLKQIHDLQEHIQEKEQQLMEIQDQHRVAQETLLLKDDQLREAQSWISRVQEMDALQSTTNHSLQTELRERTEQYNQLWLGCQRQFADLERLHLHQIQQLQLELADARERSGSYSDESHASQNNLKDVSHFSQSNGSQFEAGGNGRTNGNSGGLSNGKVENVSNFVSTRNTSQSDQVNGLSITPSIVGMPTYLPPGQVPALHPFVMHQQGVPHSLPSHVPQSHMGHFHSFPAISSLQDWQNQQAVPEGSQMPSHNQYQPSQAEQNLSRPDGNFDYEVSINGQARHPGYLDVLKSQGMESHAVMPSSNQDGPVMESMDESYLVSSQPPESLQQISSQFHDALRLDHIEQNNESQAQEKNIDLSVNNDVEVKGVIIEQANSVHASEAGILLTSFNETLINSTNGALLTESHNSAEQKPMTDAVVNSEATLLDERSLLACIVRTIPPGSGGRIRISSTLPNRLDKMLAPLHWHDYKKTYGKLEDFVASHPELFLIEGDYIQLREGAQEIIAATAAVAKVAAAAAVTSYPSWLPSVAVTPMAQSHRLKKIPSIDSKSVKDEKNLFMDYTASGTGNTDSLSHLSQMQIQHSNGTSFDVSTSVSTVKILTKPKDHVFNGLETRLSRSSVSLVGNGGNSDRSNMGVTQSKVSNQGRTNASFARKQQGRMTGAGLSSRR